MYRVAKFSLAATPVLLLLAGASGCGSDANMGKVEGIVRIDGQPLTTGVVRFVPTAGRAAEGKIGPDGTFVLGTVGEADGAVVGKHQIAVVAIEVIGRVERTSGGRPPPAQTRPLVPERYMAYGSSGLSFEVKPGRNVAEIDLTSNP